MRAQVGYGAFLFLIMDRRKALALVGKSVKETGRFGKMTPHLDGDYDPQLWVLSGKFGDVQYLVRAEHEDFWTLVDGKPYLPPLLIESSERGSGMSTMSWSIL